MGDKGETSVNSCGPRHPDWETRGRQVQTHAAQGTQSGRQGGDKCKLTRPKAPEWDANPATEAKSCGPGMQPFERSKSPIQVSLFGEKRKELLAFAAQPVQPRTLVVSKSLGPHDTLLSVTLEYMANKGSDVANEGFAKSTCQLLHLALKVLTETSS